MTPAASAARSIGIGCSLGVYRSEPFTKCVVGRPQELELDVVGVAKHHCGVWEWFVPGSDAGVIDAKLVEPRCPRLEFLREPTLNPTWSNPVQASSNCSPSLPVFVCSPIARPERGSTSNTP